MMAATTNDITGDRLASRGNSEKFKANFDRIFGKKKTATIKFKDRVTLGLSPSTDLETWDCRSEVEKAADSLLNLRYDGTKIEPTL